ncbi:MAG: glycosyltransferase family 39 protein [Gemmatimonadales bacterium]
MIAAILRLAGRTERGLGSAAAPSLVALVTVLLIFWLWGSTLRPLPWVYDEAAYLLQARIFATGSWSAPGRPMPEFFEQLHVFVTPRLVPKYPPGHALLLVPGVLLGLPALVPLLLSGLTAGLFFAALRRLAGPWVALLGWLVWITAPEELYLRPSFMSQISSGAVWLLAWLALARWRNDPRPRWLAGFGALAALGAIIRPVSAIAFLAVLGPWILWRVARDRRWSSLVAAAGVALPILAVVPWWSHSATGKAFPTPYSEYSAVYAPWNLPGFSVDHSPPRREETPAMRKFRQEWLPLHEAHTVARLPAILLERVRGLGVTFFGPDGLRWLLLAGFVVGLAVATAEIRLLLVATGALFGIHLWIAARPQWTVYYLEGFPVLAAVTALGAWRIVRAVGGRLAGGADRGRAELLAGALVLAAIVVAVPGTVGRLLRARDQQINLRLVQADLARATGTIEGEAIVFVEPGPEARPYESYVRNVPDLEAERVWVVQSRGDDDRRLLEFVGDRSGYRFDPGTGRLRPWPSAPEGTSP